MKAGFILLTILLGVASYSPLVRAQSRGTFIGTASMATARSFHTATLLLDGRVLIAGGGNNFEAGAYDAVVSPGCLIGFFGSNLAVAPFCANGAQSPTTLGGVSLTVAGLTAPLLYVSPGQINLLIPFEVQIPTSTVVPVVVWCETNTNTGGKRGL